MTASVRFVAYLPGDDDKLGFLPAPISWDVSVFHNNVSALTLKYSNLAAGGEYITRALQIGLDIGFEVNWDDGTGWHEPFDCRFVRIKNNKNDVNDPAKLVSLTCPGYGWMLSKIKNTVADNRKLKTKDTGDIVRLFWNEYAARHATKRIPIDIGSWTTGTDSAGAAWIKKKTLTFELAADLLTILQGQVDIDHCDYRFDKRSLKIWNPDSQWIDLSNTVKLRLGQEVGEAPADESLEEMIHYLLVRGEKKTKAILTNDAVTPWGIWEGCINEGGVDTNAEAASAAEKQMDLSSRMRGEYTVNLNLRPEDPLPFKDYRPGDWVEGPNMAGAPQKMRVQQITLSGEGSAVTGSVVLNDLVKASELALSSKLAAVSNGATQTGGTGTAPDEAADLRQPDAPTGFTVTPALYLTTAKRWAVRLLFEWNEVLTATDGTELAISGYRVWGAKAGETSSRVIATTPGADLSALMDGFEQGTAWTFSVQAIGVTTTEPGAQSAFVTMTLPTDTTPPPKPSTPVLASSASILTVTWDGLTSTVAAMPADLARVEVLAGLVNPPTEVVGTLNSAGTWTGFAEAGDVVYVALKPWDFSDNGGTRSDVVSTTVKSILDDTGLTAALANRSRIIMSQSDPAPDVADGDWWYKADAVDQSKVVAMYRRVAGAWVHDTLHAATVLAAQSIVSDNLAANSVVADKIMAGELYTRLSETGELKADAIRTGLLQAQITLSGVIRTAEVGARVTMDSDSGIILYDASNNEVISLRTDGNSRFQGKLLSSEVSVTGVLELQSGSAMTVNPGAVLRLEGGIQAPAVSPSIMSVYPTTVLKKADGSSFGPVDMVARDSSGSWYATRLNRTVLETNRIVKFNPDGTYNSVIVLDPAYGYTPDSLLSGITFIGSRMYVMLHTRIGAGGYEDFQVFDSSSLTAPVYLGSWDYDFEDVAALGEYFPFHASGLFPFAVGLSNDGTNLLLVSNRYQGAEILAHAPTAGMPFVWETRGALAASGSNELYRAVVAGTFDYGALHVAYSAKGSMPVRNILASNPQTEVAANMWPNAVSNTVSMGWAAGAFWTASEDGVIYTHDGPNWSAAELSRSYKAAYTFYNPAPYESKPSPVTTAAVSKRARVRINAPSWAPADPILQLKFYASLAAGSLRPQASSASGYVELTSLSTAGSDPPAASTFPASSPASINNSSGSLVISADGTIRSKLLQSSMVKTTVGHNAAGGALTAATLTRVSGFATPVELSDAPVTVDAANGSFTLLEDGKWDIDFYQRWPNFGSAGRRLGLISTGTAGTAPIGANASDHLGWYLAKATVRGMALAAGTVITFWVYSAPSTTLNPAALSPAVPFTRASIRRV